MTRSVRTFVTATLLLASCRDAVSPLDALQSARAKWAARGPSSYSVTVLRSCECTAAGSGPVIITVTSGVVTARHYAATGEAVPAEYAGAFPDVAATFEEIEDALSLQPAQATIRYHDELGYPTEISVDFSRDVADEEFIYRMSDLAPR